MGPKAAEPRCGHSGRASLGILWILCGPSEGRAGAVSIRKRGQVWQAEVRVGKDQRTGKWIKKAATFDTRAEAEEAEKRMQVQSEDQRARWIEPSTMTMAGYLGEWQAREKLRLRHKTSLNGKSSV